MELRPATPQCQSAVADVEAIRRDAELLCARIKGEGTKARSLAITGGVLAGLAIVGFVLGAIFAATGAGAGVALGFVIGAAVLGIGGGISARASLDLNIDALMLHEQFRGLQRQFDDRVARANGFAAGMKRFRLTRRGSRVVTRCCCVSYGASYI